MHIPELGQYPDTFQITAICDNVPNRLDGLPESVSDAKLYDSIEKLLADKEVDMVTIATRNLDHTPMAIMALEAGKYVVVEKPIAVTAKQIKELRDADKKYPGKMFFRFNRRFEPAFNTVRDIIKSGTLGRISMVKIYRHPGFVRRLDWQTLTKFYGGILNNWGPHLIDQAVQLLDAPITSMWSDVQHNVAAGDADDQVKVLLRGTNKRVVDVEISTCTTMPGRLYEVWGDLGSLVVPLEENVIKLRYLDPKQKLKPLEAIPGQFPLLYGNAMEELHFIEETRPCTYLGGHVLQRGKILADGTAVNPAEGYSHPDTMWGYIYQSITHNVLYPVKTEEGLKVMELLLKICKQSGYQPCESYLSGKQGRFAGQ